jgi:hypothetical protein
LDKQADNASRILQDIAPEHSRKKKDSTGVFKANTQMKPSWKVQVEHSGTEAQRKTMSFQLVLLCVSVPLWLFLIDFKIIKDTGCSEQPLRKVLHG